MTNIGHDYVAGRYRDWMPLYPLTWAVGGPNVLHIVTIPAGREFESSVPSWLWWFIAPNDHRFLLAARVHDYLLEEGYGRAQAAAEWLDAAIHGGAPRWKAKVAFIAIAAWAVLRNTHEND